MSSRTSDPDLSENTDYVFYHIDYLPRNDIKEQEKRTTQNTLFNIIHIKELRAKKKTFRTEERLGG